MLSDHPKPTVSDCGGSSYYLNFPGINHVTCKLLTYLVNRNKTRDVDWGEKF